jgi:hypothetical protein
MPEKDDVKKFKEFLSECLEEREKKSGIKEIPQEKKASMIEKFKKAIG